MKKILISFFILIQILFINTFFHKVQAKNDLDRIILYEVIVDPRKDGTLDIKVNIDWKVLDDTTEGKLEWIKIGIPNKYVDDLKAYTSNIKKISYYTDSGSFIRLDLNRAYSKGEQLHLSFSFHLSRMYFLNGDECMYDYNPGYFKDILVDKAILKWNKENVISIAEKNNTPIEEKGNYYVIEKPLGYKERISVKVNYKQNSFSSLSKDLQFSDSYMQAKDIIIIFSIIIIFATIITTAIVQTIKNKDPYMSHRGFGRVHRSFGGRRNYRYHNNGVDKDGSSFYVHTSTHSSGHSCACACACACAGGGRAGCSRKDYYNTKVYTKDILRVLSKK